jgi:hypothetical protein
MEFQELFPFNQGHEDAKPTSCLLLGLRRPGITDVGFSVRTTIRLGTSREREDSRKGLWNQRRADGRRQLILLLRRCQRDQRWPVDLRRMCGSDRRDLALKCHVR